MHLVGHVELEGLTREQWLDARRAGIGSSDAPAIAGMDDYRSPWHVYVDKLGELGEIEDNDAMRWGRRLERPVAEEAAERIGCDLGIPTLMYRHPDTEWLLASPDFFACDGETIAGIIECKTTSHFRADEWADGPPARVQVQVQHQHMVLGTTHGWVACLIDGRNFTLHECDRDDEAIAQLLAIETEFWRHVTDRVPPPVDGSESTKQAIDALYAITGGDDTETDLAAEVRDWLLEYGRCNALAAAAKREATEWRNKVAAAMGTATVGLVDGEQVCTYRLQERKETVQAASSFRVLRASKGDQ